MARLCAHGCRGRLRLPCRHDATPGGDAGDLQRARAGARLIVDVTHGRCNDAMSGQGFSNKVMMIADGETYRGCGGERRTDWDM